MCVMSSGCQRRGVSCTISHPLHSWSLNNLYKSVSLTRVVGLKQNNMALAAIHLLPTAHSTESSAAVPHQPPPGAVPPAPGPVERESCVWLRHVMGVHEAVPRCWREMLAHPLMLWSGKRSNSRHLRFGGGRFRVTLTCSAQWLGLCAVGHPWGSHFDTHKSFTK